MYSHVGQCQEQPCRISWECWAEPAAEPSMSTSDAFTVHCSQPSQHFPEPSLACLLHLALTQLCAALLSSTVHPSLPWISRLLFTPPCCSPSGLLLGLVSAPTIYSSSPTLKNKIKNSKTPSLMYSIRLWYYSSPVSLSSPLDPLLFTPLPLPAQLSSLLPPRPEHHSVLIHVWIICLALQQYKCCLPYRKAQITALFASIANMVNMFWLVILTFVHAWS